MSYELATKEELIGRIKLLEDCLSATIKPFEPAEWATLGSYLSWKRGFIQKVVAQEYPYDTLRNLKCPQL